METYRQVSPLYSSKILFKARECIDSGEHISSLTFPPTIEQFCSDDFNTSDVGDSMSLSDSDSLSLSDSENSSLDDFEI